MGIVTSDFHMPRATYIIKETLNYFYKMQEDVYRDDPKWNSTTRKYPRLRIHQRATQSYCGTDTSLNCDDDDAADINCKSLALRAMNELKYLGSQEVSQSMYGEPLNRIMYVWPIQINVTKDSENSLNFQNAMAQVMNAVQKLCVCKAAPEDVTPLIENPLQLPISTSFPSGKTSDDWEDLIKECEAPALIWRVM